jgi:hypothetical protein
MLFVVMSSLGGLVFDKPSIDDDDDDDDDDDE